MKKFNACFMLMAFYAINSFGSENYSPVVAINNPKNGEVIEMGKEITFEGTANDLEDGEILKENITWTSNEDGIIGQGNSFNYVLSPNFHIITLTATDSNGASTKKRILIKVVKPKVEPMIDDSKIYASEIMSNIPPAIMFTSVPELNSYTDLKGKVSGVDFSRFSVITYIMVDSLWWSKSVVNIDENGEWICDITTEENDKSATKIVAYLIPIDYDPPLSFGDFWIFNEVLEKSLAKVEVDRRENNTSEALKKPKNNEIYIPLKAGNSWKYKKSVNKRDLFFYYLQNVNDVWKFKVKWSIDQILGDSEEIYTIIRSKDINDITFFGVQIQGNVIRDGRYNAFKSKDDINALWYFNEGYLEILMDGDLKITGSKPIISLAIQRSKVFLFPNDNNPLLFSGSATSKEEIIVPAGKFKYCLKVYTIYGGTNFLEILLKDAQPKFRKGAGGFLTISYYAEGVGLVKEFQINSDQEITYELALIEYKLN